MTRFCETPSFHACPNCKKQYSQPRLISLNNFYDLYYFDGYEDTKTKSLFFPVVQCQACDSIFKRSELSDINAESIDSNTLNTFESIKPANVEYYFEQLNNVNNTDSNELEVRLEAMWQFNQPFRKEHMNQEIQPTQHVTLKEQAIQNENRLLELLPNSDSGLTIKADILRRRSLFNDAKELMRQITTSELRHNKALFNYLCTRKIVDVVHTSFDPDPDRVICKKMTEDQKQFARNQKKIWDNKRYLTIATSSRYSFYELLTMLCVFISAAYFIYFLIS